MIAGFSSVVTSARVPGGYILLVGANLLQCLDACLMTSYCLAVDYDSTTRSCSVHGTGTYCNDVTSFTTSTHYKRVPCLAFSATGNKHCYRSPSLFFIIIIIHCLQSGPGYMRHALCGSCSEITHLPY